ncbi:MAG: ComEC/Rec2 family competence protein [Gaiellaceae bacterium]
MIRRVARRPEHSLVGAMCGGLAASNLARPGLAALACAAAACVGSLFLEDRARLVALAVALSLAGWWWGGARLDVLDRSVLKGQIGRAGRALAVVTAPARRGRLELRVQAETRQLGRLRVREPVLLLLPLGRSPPQQGAELELVAEVRRPRIPADGFDEERYLRRRGIHVVLRASHWRVVGRRDGLGAVADGLRGRVARTIGSGSGGEREALLLGIVLGDDGGLSEELRDRFRASGLYHLLAVSGQNVALVAAGALLAAWLLGLSRWLGEVGALAAIAAYVLAVGAQPSVVRAGIAGALGSLAWLAARERDRWYFLLLGALALLTWNPYSALDPGFQLSFAAVIAIFVVAPRIERALEGYPVPPRAAGVLAVSTACGLVTAPILWFQFHAVPLLAVPANALAAPAMVPVLGLGLAAVAVDPVLPAAAAVLVWLAGWCAAYVALCARLIGALPGAQLESGWVAGVAAVVAAGAAAYAWRRCRGT